jgi:hypothetical protein
MKVRLPHLPLFVDEIERLNHFIDVLNALDRHFARPQGARVYAAWRSTLNDRDTSYLLGRNVFVHASVPKGFYREFVQAYAHHGHTPMARYARLNRTPALLTWREHRQRLKSTRDGLWFHELAERHGILDGLYCSHRQWTVGFWTPTIFKPTEDDRKILDIAAYFAAARLEQLMVARKKKLDSVAAPLSPREQLSLIRSRWVTARKKLPIGSASALAGSTTFSTPRARSSRPNPDPMRCASLSWRALSLEPDSCRYTGAMRKSAHLQNGARPRGWWRSATVRVSPGPPQARSRAHASASLLELNERVTDARP